MALKDRRKNRAVSQVVSTATQKTTFEEPHFLSPQTLDSLDSLDAISPQFSRCTRPPPLAQATSPAFSACQVHVWVPLGAAQAPPSSCALRSSSLDEQQNKDIAKNDIMFIHFHSFSPLQNPLTLLSDSDARRKTEVTCVTFCKGSPLCGPLGDSSHSSERSKMRTIVGENHLPRVTRGWFLLGLSAQKHPFPIPGGQKKASPSSSSSHSLLLFDQICEGHRPLQIAAALMLGWRVSGGWVEVQKMCSIFQGPRLSSKATVLSGWLHMFSDRWLFKHQEPGLASYTWQAMRLSSLPMRLGFRFQPTNWTTGKWEMCHVLKGIEAWKTREYSRTTGGTSKETLRNLFEN